MKPIKRLGDAELDIMQIIWSADGTVNSQFVAAGLRGKRDWQLPTILTVLSRLVTKGFLSVQNQGRSNIYTPEITELEYQEAEGKMLLEKVYNGSIKSLVRALVGAKAVTRQDISELQAYLSELAQSSRL